MDWNPYIDQKNRAFSRILTALFPEQTKTVPRIIIWSLIFLLDLTLGIAGASHLGLLWSGNTRITSALLVAAIVGVFWLQGFIWNKITVFFQHRNRIEP
ncbi:MAG: hypothetical protein J6J12_05310 [Oscillospiraceae bacterium]|nr:hypothetical protein [Oscillospiraceae bacterium]